MADSVYNKQVNSKNSVNLSNFSFSSSNIAGYHKSVGSGTSSGVGTSMTSSITLNLDDMLTDNLDETVTAEEIKNPKAEETKKGFFENLGDTLKSTGATVAVGATSILSGVLDIGEAILDGGTWALSKVVGLFSSDTEEALKEFIARDLVSEANEAFYENTELGRSINDASYMKYDSEIAQGIRSVTEDVGVFVLATALTVSPLVATAPLTIGLGAAYGMGNTAEDTYATVGTDTSTIQELLILGNGALSALSWSASGKLGKGFIEIGKSMAEAGVKEILAEMCKGIFSKEMLKELFKPMNVVGNAIASLMQTGGEIGRIATKLYNGGEVTAEEWALLVGELIVYFGLNVAEDALRTEITEFKAPSQNEKAYQSVDDISTVKEPEILETGDIAPTGASPATDDIATIAKYSGTTNNYEAEIYDLAKKMAEGKISIENLADLDPSLRLEAMKKLDSEQLWSLFVDEFKKDQNILNKFNQDDFNELFGRMTPTELVDSIFADGRKMAIEDYNAFFKNFREHAAEHTMEVRNYAIKIAEQSGIPPSALAEVYYGAQYHDLGMRGGLYRNSSGDYVSISSLDTSIVKGKDISDYVTGEQGTEFTRLVKKYQKQLEDLGISETELKKQASTKALDEIMLSKYNITDWSQNPDPSRISDSLLNEVYSNVRAGFARKNHPLNSALSILTEDVTPDGVDKNVVALLAMSHSKSTSGIKHFDNPDEWKKCIKELEKALKAQDPTAKLDVEALYKLIDDPVSFEILQRQALCIRDGDAMSLLAKTADGDTLMQTGNASHLDFTYKRTDCDDPVLSPEDELDSFKDVLIDTEGNLIGEVTNSFSKTTHAGELNVKFDSSYDGNTYQATITLNNPNHVPNCSMSSIEERIGEVVTYTNVQGANKQVIIELPKDAQGKALGDWYETALDGLKTKEINKTISEYLEKTMGKNDWNSLELKERDVRISFIRTQLASGETIEGLDLSRIEFFSGDGLTGNIKIVYN